MGKLDEKLFWCNLSTFSYCCFVTCGLAHQMSHSDSDWILTGPHSDIERHLLVNIASSENTRNSCNALFRSIHVYILHMTKKLEYLGGKKKLIEFSLESLSFICYIFNCFSNLGNFATLKCYSFLIFLSLFFLTIFDPDSLDQGFSTSALLTFWSK